MKIEWLRIRLRDNYVGFMNELILQEDEPEYIQDIKDGIKAFKEDIMKAASYEDFMNILGYHGYSIDDAGEYLFDIIIDR